MYQTPVKSSLSEARKKVSYEFFADAFRADLPRFKKMRKTYRGHYINAVDGSDLDLPASVDVIEAGFRGTPWSKEYETHYPKMHVVHAYDVINGLVSAFKYSTKYSEKALAMEMVSSFEKKSLTIYDRLFCGHPTFKAHTVAGNLFLVRAVTCGERVPECIRDFLTSDRVDQNVMWKPKKLRKSEALRVRLIKVRHPKTGETSVLITNAPRTLFTRLELAKLYLKRWEIESSFKDLVSTLKMDQWHSTKINGILQEIYCLLWVANATKMQMRNMLEEDPLAIDYCRSNFKMCVSLVAKNMALLIRRKQFDFFDILDYWTRKTRERRRHRSRTYPRVVRSYGTGFSADCKVLRKSRCA